MSKTRLIGYIRVSTSKQGESGLGLEGQRAAIATYATSQAGEVVQVYREVESGTDNTRPELKKAVAHAKRIRATLVIAKLDRLARNVAFVANLMESGCDFVATDQPAANRLTIHILAAVAEDEARRISERTTAALAAAKARGQLLGSARPGHWKGRESQRLAGLARARQAIAAKRQAESAPVYGEALPVARTLREAGESLQTIADRLNDAGLATVRGMAWGPMQVSRLLA